MYGVADTTRIAWPGYTVRGSAALFSFIGVVFTAHKRKTLRVLPQPAQNHYNTNTPAPSSSYSHLKLSRREKWLVAQKLAVPSSS